MATSGQNFGVGTSGICGVGLIATSVIVLFGWWIGNIYLTSILPHYVSMKINTALAFGLSGIAILIFERRNSVNTTWLNIARISAIGVGAIGILTLLEYFLDVDIGIDRLLVTELPNAPGTSHPGRMPPPTAANFVITGISLLMIATRRPHLQRLGHYLSIFVGAAGAVAASGYIFGATFAHGIGQYTQMAALTSLSFLVVSIGTYFLPPRTWFGAIFTSPSSAGVVTRALTWAAVLVPVGTSWLSLLVIGNELVDTGLAIAILTVLRTGILFAFIFITARAIARTDWMRVLIDHSNDMITKVSPDGRFLYLNPSFEKITGWATDEWVGKSVLSLIHPDDQAQSTERIQALGQGRDILIKDTRLRKKSGGYVTVEANSVPIFEGGQPVGILSIAREVTQRRKTEEELRQLNAELESVNHLLDTTNKELEAFSYSVSHDLRAPLRGIDGFSKLLLDRYPDQLDERGKGYLMKIRAATQRMGQLIDDILGLSRIGRSELHREDIDLSPMIQEITKELRRREPQRQVEVILPDHLPANGDPRLLKIALENLLSNAWKFSSKHQMAKIEVGIIDHPGGKKEYFVRDDGAGFSMEYASKLFSAFQRLHDTSEFPGTGIGLATVQRIVRKHGGTVRAEAAVEQGATFYFFL